MRKIAVLLVAAVLGFSAVGCGGDKPAAPKMEEKKPDAAAPAPAEPKKEEPKK